MNPAPQTSVPRRHVWRWVLLGTGLCLAPFVCLAVVAASFLTLERDASVLRRHVMDATDGGWHTKVQVSLGRLSLGAVRQGLGLVHAKGVAEAREALGAIHHASVGVYERSAGGADWSREELFGETDKAMRKRGWVRLVGVADKRDNVLVYVPQDLDSDGPVDLCVAVVNGKELVVVSTSVNADKLAAFVERQAGKDGRAAGLRFAKFRL